MTTLNQLSKREWEVVQLLLQGKSNKLIALSLGISIRTVEFHLKNIYAKNQISSRTELILKLANTKGSMEKEKLGSSTVDAEKKNSENREKSFGDALSLLRQELRSQKPLQFKASACRNYFRTAHRIFMPFHAN